MTPIRKGTAARLGLRQLPRWSVSVTRLVWHGTNTTGAVCAVVGCGRSHFANGRCFECWRGYGGS